MNGDHRRGNPATGQQRAGEGVVVHHVGIEIF
jgi:hypothetical protein